MSSNTGAGNCGSRTEADDARDGIALVATGPGAPFRSLTAAQSGSADPSSGPRFQSWCGQHLRLTTSRLSTVPPPRRAAVSLGPRAGPLLARLQALTLPLRQQGGRDEARRRIGRPAALRPGCSSHCFRCFRYSTAAAAAMPHPQNLDPVRRSSNEPKPRKRPDLQLLRESGRKNTKPVFTADSGRRD
jgi:hypothetical protein